MAGIYLHIPFCKQACHYCNFHFSTSLKQKDLMVAAIIKEIALQKEYLLGKPLQSVYFGGGTPSLLEIKDLELIFDAIHQHHSLAADAEITLEANPDDLTIQKLKDLSKTAINRLSIGTQSFFEEDLKWMNRAHTSQEAKTCIQAAQDQGFDNLTIDLIYGTPTTTNKMWEQNIQTAIDLNIAHLSCYCLTVEPNTALDHFVKKGIKEAVDEEKSAQQFEILMQQTVEAGYEHYEISNFAKPNCHARHNSNYWLGASYLGLGPSAHSFNGDSRQWNIANNAKYINAIEEGLLPFEKEQLTPDQQYNEYILTALRTKWGCQLQKISTWGLGYEQYFLKTVEPYLKEELIQKNEQTYTLTSKGKLLADRIAMELFI